MAICSSMLGRHQLSVAAEVVEFGRPRPPSFWANMNEFQQVQQEDPSRPQVAPADTEVGSVADTSGGSGI